MNTNKKDVAAGKAHASAADRELADQRAKNLQQTREIEQAKRSGNTDHIDSERAAANEKRKAELRDRINSYTSNDPKFEEYKKNRMAAIDNKRKIQGYNNEIQNGHVVTGVFKKLGNAVKNGVQTTIKHITGKESVDDSVIDDIYTVAIENIDVWMDVTDMSDDEFSLLLESATLDELRTLECIMTVESIASAIDSTINAVKSNDADSDDVLLESSALLSEYGLDSIYSMILEYTN